MDNQPRRPFLLSRSSLLQKIVIEILKLEVIAGVLGASTTESSRSPFADYVTIRIMFMSRHSSTERLLESRYMSENCSFAQRRKFGTCSLLIVTIRGPDDNSAHICEASFIHRRISVACFHFTAIEYYSDTYSYSSEVCPFVKVSPCPIRLLAPHTSATS